MLDGAEEAIALADLTRDGDGGARDLVDDLEGGLTEASFLALDLLDLVLELASVAPRRGAPGLGGRGSCARSQG